MKMRNVTLAAIQPPNLREGSTPDALKADNLRIVLALMDEAVAKGADIICLPETFQVRGVVNDAATAREFADDEGGALSQALCAFAATHQVNVIAPVLGRYGATLRNVAWVISRTGDLIGRYFKVHLTHGEHERGIVPGDEWPVFELDGVRVGVMTCHDIGFPESARCLALNGAELVCWPHVQSGWGDVVWDITLRSRAIDNSVYLMSSCYGVPPDTAWRPGMMVGRSGVVGPDGTVLVDGGREPGVFTTTIDFDKVLLKHHFTYVGDHDFRRTMNETRRPDTYAPITRSEVTPPSTPASHETERAMASST